jgi:hypothetical protein
MTTEMWLIAAFRIAGALPVLRWPLAGAFTAIFTDLGDLFLREWIDLGGVKEYQRFDKWLDQAYMLTFLAVALRWQALPRNIALALYAYRLAGFITFELTADRDILLLFPNLFEYWFIFIAALKTFGWEATDERGAPLGGSGSPIAEEREGAGRPRVQPTSPPAQQLSLTRSGDAPAALRTYPFHSWLLIGPIARFAIPYRYTRAQLAVALAVILAAKLFHEYTLHVGQWFESFTPNEALEAIWRFLTPSY